MEPPPASGVQEDEKQPEDDILEVSDVVLEEVPDVMMEVEVEEVEKPGNRGLPNETDVTKSDLPSGFCFKDQQIQVNSLFQGCGLRMDKVCSNLAMTRYYMSSLGYAHFKYFFQIMGPATASLAYKCQPGS